MMANIESNGSKKRMDARLKRMHEIECRICDFNIDGVCKLDGGYIPKIGCAGGKVKIMTNADCIRAMSDEELADWFADMNKSSAFCPNDGEGIDCQDDCEKCWFDWLKEEAKGEGDEQSSVI